jgi:hypothetical protein
MLIHFIFIKTPKINTIIQNLYSNPQSKPIKPKLSFKSLICRNPTLAKCEDETHIPQVGELESSGTPECLEFDSKVQNSLH